MCATSIGSTFSHRPVPGERKSGMPLGTDMPAPVNATVQREERISSASRSTPGSALFAFKPRRPLLEKRGDSLARVLGLEHVAERLLLGGNPLVEIGLVRHALDALGRQRRLTGKLPRLPQRRSEQPVVGDG